MEFGAMAGRSSTSGTKTLAAPRTRNGETSITDVARRARVSIGTVSRVMNQHPSVGSDIRRRVWLASRELGFVPRQQHRCIALITGRRSPALPVGYVSVLTSLISQHLAERRYSVELIDVENLDLAYEAHIEGAIGIVFDDRLANLKSIPNLPLVTVNRPMLELGIHSIRTDHYAQAVIATQHLLQRGHRRIGLLAIEPEWGAQERVRGYRDALAAAGVSEDAALVQFTIEQPVYDILNRFIGRGVSAILNFSEDTSLEVLHILSNVLKLRIGQDISTISLEDLPIYQYLSPPQTAVHQPLGELARVAVETVLELCAARGEPSSDDNVVDLCLPTELIERDSVAQLDVGDN